MFQYWLDKMQVNGMWFINISLVCNDFSVVFDVEWLVIWLGIDIVLLLVLSYVLIVEFFYDQVFVVSYIVGFVFYCVYLLGEYDGVVKILVWVVVIIGLDVQCIVDLVWEMVCYWMMVNILWFIQCVC